MICRWCGCVVQPVPGFGGPVCAPITRRWTDVTPRSAGGSNDVDNLVMSCHQCNTLRSRQSGSLGPMTRSAIDRIDDCATGEALIDGNT